MNANAWIWAAIASASIILNGILFLVIFKLFRMGAQADARARKLRLDNYVLLSATEELKRNLAQLSSADKKNGVQ